ncbi:MAG: FtsH protease activity modulator HflK [Burkholderiales bacterium]
MAWNDPQWGGNKNNGGPPDLDELWRKLNQRLNGLFGGKGSPASPAGNARPPRIGGGIGLLVAVAVVVWVGSGFYIVDAAKRGVVLRFGKYIETTLPGPHWHLPYPVETVEVVNLDQVRTVEVGYRGNVKNKMLKESLMLTDDENIIDIQFAVQYILKNPEDYLFKNRSPDDAVLQAAETSIREIVGKSKMDFVLYEAREEVAVRAAKSIQEILDRYQTGIKISKVTMQNAQPPEQVQAAFDDAVKAGQDKERQKNEGQAYANDVVPKARGAAARLLEEANGYKQRVIANAEGDASRFKQIVSEYNKAPAVTRDRLYLDAMQQMLSSSSKVLVDQKGGNSMLYLPLDKLIQQNAASSATDAAPVQPKGQAAPPVPAQQDDATVRSRDAFRSREREARP